MHCGSLGHCVATVVALYLTSQRIWQELVAWLSAHMSASELHWAAVSCMHVVWHCPSIELYMQLASPSQHALLTH